MAPRLRDNCKQRFLKNAKILTFAKFLVKIYLYQFYYF